MKQCAECRPDPANGGRGHEEDDRPRKEWSCNWLDWMAEDDRCPHCGGPVVPISVAPLGALMDSLGAALEGKPE